jgi:peptide/nickel transport system permease protein
MKRLAWGVLVLLLVAVLTFFLSRVVPADPAAFLAGQNASEETVARIRAEYGLDRPLAIQFARYLGGLVHGDFGESIRTHRSVAEDLGDFLPATLELLIVSFILYLLLSFYLAVAAARRAGGWLDSTVRLGTMLGTGIPVFWLGMALQFFFFYKLHWLPLSGRFPIREVQPPTVTGFLLVDSILAGDPSAFWASLRSLILPALTIVLNLLSPILTVTTMQFGYMISWVILVEVIFDWPGIGLYAYQSFQVFDYAPVIALAIVSTAGFVLINLAMDLLYPVIDPRVRSLTA